MRIIERTGRQATGTAPILLLLALNVVAGVDRMIFAVLAPAIQPALHLSNPQLGIVQGPAFALPYAIVLPFAGWLADRRDPRRILTGAVALWTAGLAASAAATGIVSLVAGRALCGLGQAALLPVALQVIGGTVRPGRIGRAIALFTGVGTLGRSAAFALGGLLLVWSTRLGVASAWSSSLAALVPLNLVLLAAVAGGWRAGPPAAGDDGREAGRTAGLATLWRLVRGAPVLVGGTAVAALGPVVIVQAVTGWVASLLTQTYRLPPSRAAFLIALATLASPLGNLLGGWAMDRARARPRRAVLVQAGLIAPCVPAMAALAWGGSIAAAVVAVAVLMLFAGAGAIAGLERVQRLAPAATRGIANGVFLLLVNVLGVGGGPFAAGLLATHGRGIGSALVALVTIAATISIAGALATITGDRSAE